MKAKLEKGKENNLNQISEKPGEKYLSIRRISYLLLTVIFTVSAEFVLALIKGSLPDIAILVLILSIVFLLVFFIELRALRLNNELSYDDTSYRNIFIAIIISLILMVSAVFLPEYFFPSAVIAVLLTSVMDARLSFPAGIFLLIIFSVISGSGGFVLGNALLIFVIVSLLCDYRRENGFSFYLMIILFMLQLLMPQIFYYFTHASYRNKYFLYGAVEALIDCLVFYFIFPLFQRRVMEEETKVFDSILDDDYSLVRDMRHFSVAEYQHARRVEKAARGCAKIINIDETTVAAAGFYYRLGKMYGEPENENAVKAAVNHCFPNSVIDIISKYGLKGSLPLSREEAVVHISNEVVTRLELLDSEKKDTFSNGWNQSVLVIQLLNELSSKGIYDESKLSINQFLKIRDFLAGTDLMKID